MSSQVEASRKAMAMLSGLQTPATSHVFDEHDVLLTWREAATYLRKSVATMERWARQGTGPAFTYCGRSPLYPLTSLRAYARGEAVA